MLYRNLEVTFKILNILYKVKLDINIAINIFLFITFSISTNSLSQQPAYSILGENQFKGIQIYDVIQDQNFNYWFATSDGLYVYDYIKYEKVECEEAKGNSFFNFVVAENGTIYCHNLNNQIFKIKNKKCTVFYEIQESDARSDMSLAIAKNDELIIGAKNILQLNRSGKLITRYKIENHFIGLPFKASPQIIQFHLNNCDSIIEYKQGNFKKLKLNYESKSQLINNHIFRFFSLNNSSFALDLNSKSIFKYNPSTLQLTLTNQNSAFQRSLSTRIYETGNHIWIAGTLPGVFLFKSVEEKSFTQLFYKDYLISDIYKDHEGNFLLSTFDKGVIIVPDLSLPDVMIPFKDYQVSEMYSDNDLGLIVGTSNGKLFQLQNNKLKIIDSTGSKPIKGIFGKKGSPFIFFDNDYIRCFHKQKNQILDVHFSSFKDLVFISNNEFYLGTNLGVFRTVYKNNQFESKKVEPFNKRIYALEYNQKNKSLYVTSTEGLQMLNLDGKVYRIKFKNKDIYPTSIYFHKNILYVLTRKNGILMVQNHLVIGQFKLGKDIQLDQFEKLLFKNNQIILKSSKGLYLFNIITKKTKFLHCLYGFSDQRILNFELHKNDLYVSHTNGLQQLKLNYANQTIKLPKVRLLQIQINDKKVNSQIRGDFSHLQNKISFYFSIPTLKNQSHIHFYYKLTGYENKWSINNFNETKITYNALPPGHYNLILKAESLGKFSSPIYFSFTISQPFYKSWWFILLCALSFVGMVYFIYNRKLSIQQKKSDQINELNESKLTAIKSQMNPHFIFNSLNSIQDLILKGDVEHSYSYITTFSNLVRRTLDYSGKDFIDFENEIKLLDLYLSLEKLRFKKDFDYSIITKNTEDILIPPLLIQPFIENSLIHGLLHKDGFKKLILSFEAKEEILVCSIEDNGIGREKANEIRQRQRAEHESFSSKAIKHRFEILSSIYEGSFGYEYEDLFNSLHESMGTKVVLTIPIKMKF